MEEAEGIVLAAAAVAGRSGANKAECNQPPPQPRPMSTSIGGDTTTTPAQAALHYMEEGDVSEVSDDDRQGPAAAALSATVGDPESQP